MAQSVDGHYGYSYYLMDYCKFGNLEAQLRRAARDGPNRRERYFPEPVLWRFFDCLVKGGMAMEEPPMQNTVLGTCPADARGDFLPEQITANNQGREGIAHMDLVSHASRQYCLSRKFLFYETLWIHPLSISLITKEKGVNMPS